MKVMIHDDDGDIEDAAAEDNDDDEDMRQTPLWKWDEANLITTSFTTN